jgi:2-hydroxy-3-keto-5-methylthiopentenyl-1-phosphate phosphatase
MKYALFIDFDGTVTLVDTLEYLLNNFADASWQNIEEQIAKNEISEAVGLKEQFKLINVEKEKALERLDTVVQLDPFAIEFFQWCEDKRIPTTIVSGGFRWIISHFLKKHGIQKIDLKSNDSIVENGKWKIIPGDNSLDCNKCNHCKTQYIHSAKNKGFTTIYIGNGNTDRCPSMQADIVFAKAELKKFCQKEKIQFYSFRDLGEVMVKLENLFIGNP